MKATNTLKQLHERQSIYSKEISLLFYELYGDRPQAKEAFHKLTSCIEKLFGERPKKLVKLDEERSINKNWLLSEQHVGMALYVDRFAENLVGLVDKLDYLDDLGVNCVHLMPIMKRRKGESDGGYAVADFLKVDPLFGKNSDLTKLGNELKKRDQLLLLDFVMNHTADDHEWVKKAKAGDEFYQDFFLMYDDRTVPDAFEQNLLEVFAETHPGNFTFDEDAQKWVFTTFHSYQWDLNYKNPHVFIAMLENICRLSNFGADIIRVDAPAFMWKKMGTTSQNLDEVHVLLQLLRACMNIIAPGVALLSEAIVAPHEIMKYYGTGDKTGKECQLSYNAMTMALLWDTVATQNNRLMLAAQTSMPSKPLGTTWLNYVRCHDDIGLGYDDEHIRKAGFDPFMHRQYLIRYLVGEEGHSNARGARYMYNPKTKDARISGAGASLIGLEKAIAKNDEAAIDQAIRHFVTLHGIVLSLGGFPMLYYGDEQAMMNDYSYLHKEDQKHDNRWMHRPLYNEETFDFVKNKGTHQYKMFSQLQHLIGLRKQLPEFADYNNIQFWNIGNEQILAYTRTREHKTILVIANLSNRIQMISSDDLKEIHQFFNYYYEDVITEERLFENSPYFKLEPYQLRWVRN